MRGVSKSFLSEKQTYLLLMGATASVSATVLAEGNCLAIALSVFGSFISVVGGVTAIRSAIPIVFHFNHNDWKVGDENTRSLFISEKTHGKGMWPTYKTLENNGEVFGCDTWIYDNGDIEFRVPIDEKDLSGRIHIK